MIGLIRKILDLVIQRLISPMHQCLHHGKLHLDYVSVPLPHTKGLHQSQFGLIDGRLFPICSSLYKGPRLRSIQPYQEPPLPYTKGLRQIQFCLINGPFFSAGLFFMQRVSAKFNSALSTAGSSNMVYSLHKWPPLRSIRLYQWLSFFR